MFALLWLIAIVVLVFWALGAFVANLGGLVHLLLIVVLVLVIVNLIGGIRGRH